MEQRETTPSKKILFSKIINDPLYGLVHVNDTLILALLDHPFFQRLRRISQMGMTFLVYPGSTHNRLHHSLGAYFLMQKAITSLRNKGVDISAAEEQACLIAILLHDVGHGPFSHALEGQILPFSHEVLSLKYMEMLNKEFDKKLELAITIFRGKYKKKFLYQLISSQMDLDRLDYLARDSFYTGVVEGCVGYDRIINMMNVKNDELVIEEKGLNSIENFLLARHFMYQQVYYHKTSLVAEYMLTTALQCLKKQITRNPHLSRNDIILKLWSRQHTQQLEDEDILLFSKIDDTDIWQMLKIGQEIGDGITTFFSKGLLNRNLLKVKTVNEESIKEIREKINKALRAQYKNYTEEEREILVFEKKISLAFYTTQNQPILLLQKDGTIRPIEDQANGFLKEKNKQIFTKHYLCYPAYCQGIFD